MSDRDERETPTKRKSDIIKRFSLKRLRSVRKSRSSAGDDADSISVTSTTPEKIKLTPRQSLSNYAPSIESPLSRSKIQNVVSRPPTPTVDIPPEQFWNRAYDRLKSKQPKLVDHYERILSLELRKIDIELDHLDIQNVIAERAAQRTPQMDRLLKASFASMENHSDTEGNFGTAIDIILSLRSAIASTRTGVPISAIVWTGLCIALGLYFNPTCDLTSKGDEVAILIQRMKWYSSLPKLLDQQKSQDKQLADLRTKLADQILGFYHTVIEYTVQSVSVGYRHDTLTDSLESLKLDQWTGSLDEIDKAESSLRSSLCLFDGRQDGSDLAKNGISPLSEKDREIMTACYVDDTSSELKSPKDQNDKSPSESRQDVLNTMEYTHFVNRHSDNTARVFWIGFNTPKGRETPLVEVIQSLQSQLQTHFDEPCLSYFFCEGVDTTVDTVTAPLKGLIWMLLRQTPTLIGYLRKEFEDAGHDIFNGPSAFGHLKEVFLNMIHDSALGRIYLVIDSLDELEGRSGLSHLLDLVVESSTNPKVKWILSSRNRANIDGGLSRLPAASLLSLDLSDKLEDDVAEDAVPLNSSDPSSEIAAFTQSGSLPKLGTVADFHGESKAQTYPDPNTWRALLSFSNVALLLGIFLLVHDVLFVYVYRDDLPALKAKLYDILRDFYDFN